MALRGERGAVAAEFVIVLPAVLVVLALAVGAILLATHRVTLTSAAAEIARLEACGDHSAARARLSGIGAVDVSRERVGPLHCVVLSARPGSALLAMVEIGARGCAAVSMRAGEEDPP